MATQFNILNDIGEAWAGKTAEEMQSENDSNMAMG